MEVPAGEFQVPEAWNMKNTKGTPIRIWVGGCVEEQDGKRVFLRSSAHAHSYFSDPNEGWTCVHKGQHVVNDDGTPHWIMLHEWAHHLVPNCYHTLAWAKKCAELGAPGSARACCAAFRKWEARRDHGAKTKTRVDRKPLPVGTKLVGTYKGREYFAEVASERGSIWMDGRYYSSLSNAVQQGIGYQINGWRFWQAIGE